MTDTLNTLWTLTTDRDGTEDVAIIRDAAGETLATSRPFWLPEDDEPTPPTLAAMRAMVAAPKLLEALEAAESFIRGFEDDELQEGIDDLLAGIRTAIAEATGRAA